MISEQAAFTYGLLRTDVALYPRGLILSRYLQFDKDFGPDSIRSLQSQSAEFRSRAMNLRGEEKARLQILADDCDRAIAFLEENDPHEYDATAEIAHYFDVAERYLRDGLTFNWHRPTWVLTERFTEPFSERDWFAFAQTNDPTKPGIEFLRRYMLPDVAALATLHENVHHAAQGPMGYLRYFDEGIANLLAYIIHHHYTSGLEGVRVFHTFLDEINALYAYPPMVRIMAALIQQVGMKGLYSLILERVNNPERIDWAKVLDDVRRGELEAKDILMPARSTQMPELVESLEESAKRVISVILFPERALVSPVAYQLFIALCNEGGSPII